MFTYIICVLMLRVVSVRIMALTGKLEIEIETETEASKFFKLFLEQLHHLPNVLDSIHHGELYEGDYWHDLGSVKRWTYTVDGQVVTCKERIEAIDEENKTLTFDFFEGDVMELYKSFKITLKVSDKQGGGGGAIAKWTYDYQKHNDRVPDPKAYLDLAISVTKDADAHLFKAY